MGDKVSEMERVDLTNKELKIIEKKMNEGRIAIDQYIFEMNGKPHPMPPEKK